VIISRGENGMDTEQGQAGGPGFVPRLANTQIGQHQAFRIIVDFKF
jgi:hypothetical protein